MGQTKRFTIKQLVTVEPIIFFYAYALLMHGPVINQYIYSRIAKSKGFTYMTNRASSCGNVTSLNDTMKDLEKQVQSLSSYVHLGVLMFSSIPSLFTSLLIGSWTDSRGRKPALFLPALGSSIEAGLVILIMYMEWPVYILFFGAAINGICGHFTTIVTGVMAYIADTTDESQRSLRLAFLELLTFVGGMISQLTSGLWIKKYGFIAPYWFIFGCLLFSVLYTMFFLPESRLPSDMQQEKVKLFSWKSVKRIFKVYTTSRQGGRCNLFLLTFSIGIIASLTMGLGPVLNLFIIHIPLCFSPEWVGYFTAWRSLSIGIGAVVGIKVLGMCISELTISRIGIFTRFISLIVLGYSKSSVQVFMGPLVGLLNGSSSPIFRGMLSRVVSEDEQGALFSAVASLETLSTLIGAFIFSTLYPASLKMDFSPLVFLVGAGLLVLPFSFTLCLKNPMSLLSKKDQEQILGNYKKMDDINLNSDQGKTTFTNETSPCSKVRQHENTNYGSPEV